MKSFFNDFFSLIFPRVCFSCGATLKDQEAILCTFCEFHLPRAHYLNDHENPVSQLFWGRIQVVTASSFLLFSKGGKVQHLLHYLKYRGHPEIGVHLGKLYGLDIINIGFYDSYEYIVPVPLHPSKLRKRGYNQSEQFAAGLSDTLGIPVDTKTLFRCKASDTQTKKTRFRRWENVRDIFDNNEAPHLINRHVLLVDDVITTGATIESCAIALKNVPGIRISVASIAFAYR